MGRVAERLEAISLELADLAMEVGSMEDKAEGDGKGDRPITEADLRRFKRMQMWSAANPDWEG